jgi:hypothetical protein
MTSDYVNKFEKGRYGDCPYARLDGLSRNDREMSSVLHAVLHAMRHHGK